MIPVGPALRALAAIGCVLAVTGCSFSGSVDTASESSPATPSTSSAGAQPTPSTAPASSPAGTTSPGPGPSAPPPGTAAPSDGGPVTTPAPSSPAGSPPGEATTGAPAPPPTSAPPSSATDRCHSGDLVGRLATEDSSAGHRHAAVQLRNISGRTCQLVGYGGVQLVDEYQQTLPTRQVRDEPPAPAAVAVPPGGTVSSQLTWATVPGDADAASGPCQPTPTTLAVIPPDETRPLIIDWDLGPVCQGGTITQQPYR